LAILQIKSNTFLVSKLYTSISSSISLELKRSLGASGCELGPDSHKNPQTFNDWSSTTLFGLSFQL
jgi:hypothetical protein